MFSENIKFCFDSLAICEEDIERVFLSIVDLINVQFDKDLNPYSCDNKDIYLLKDISNKSDLSIEDEINSFFQYDFDEIVDVPLYKFLVLRNHGKFSILGNIHKLIFDYTSVNFFYSLFDELDRLNELSFNNDILPYYDSLNEYLSSSDFENDSSYWKNNLSDIGEHVKFHNVKSNSYQTIKIPFDKKTLNEVTSNLNVSSFNFIAGVFTLYLTRIDRTKGILLKTTIPNKENNIGPFDKTSLLKIDYHNDYSFIDYLNEIHSVFSDITEHTPFNIENYIENDLSLYSIYDFTNFNENIFFRNGDNSAFTLNIYPEHLELVYNADLFPYIYVEHASRNIESLLANVLSNPNQIISEINILSDEEISLISEYSQGEKVDLVKDRSLSYDFRQHALEHPDIIAVNDGVNQISYGDLEKLSNSIAYDLSQNYGIGEDDPVCIMLPRNIDYMSAVLSVNKLGAFFIPLDASYPAKRIEHMIKLSQSGVVITNKQFAKSFDFGIDVIYIEDLKKDYDIDVAIQAREHGLMALMFTSGTTGLPKGVMISNHQAIGMVTAYDTVFHLSPGEVVGIFVSFSFVASYRLYCGLCLGGTCRIFNETEQRDSLLLLKELKEKPMSDIILPPGIGVPIFEYEDLKLKYMILAGAKVNELSNKDSNTKIVNFYGMTESIISIATIYDLNKLDAASVPIGRPAANTWIYILDENGMQVPVGVPGEICISSDFLSPGYYNNPDLTEKCFIDNPYCDCEDNKRLYRSGDMGFYNFEGLIEFLGREDDQLSVRGFRIESMEILNLMNSFDEISQVILDADYDNLIAYYTTNNNLDVEIIKNALKEELPYYMIPSLFVELEKIPLNPHGKIDKFALKQLFKENAEVDIEDDVLRTVMDSFKEILQVESVLMDDDFVALGGNSLSAMKLQILLKDKLGANIFSNEILNLSTPVNISNKIKYDFEVYSNISVNYSFDDLCPLSESQLNVYLDETVNQMGTAYNNPFKITLKKHYPISDIKRAIKKLTEVHKVLSARVTVYEGDLYFSFDASPEIISDSFCDDASFVLPFGLDKSLARFLIFDENGESNCLYVDFHHLIFDGSSLNILIDTLLSLLDGEDLDLVDDGILRQISFEEFIMDSDYMENAKQFYDSILLDNDEVNELLPSADHDSSDNFEYIDIFKLDDLYLNSFLQNHSITHNQFFASVFAYTLSRFTGSAKVLFNIVEDGRGHVDLSNSVGMYVRTLPLILDCTNQKVTSFLSNSSSLINTSMNYDLYPFQDLARDYDLNSDILFQYSHNLFNAAIHMDTFDYEVEELRHDVSSDLSFNVFDYGEEGFGLRVLYSNKYSKKFIQKFVDSFKLILDEIMRVNTLSEINYISSFDLKLLENYNSTETSLDHDDILDAFVDCLIKNPNNNLVSFKDISYTYGEGAFIADETAKALFDLGMGLQDNVSFLVDRSELYMFCVLGILSAGGVYVPLDNNLPDERIGFMIKDSESKILIVSDETIERAENLQNKDLSILNISDIFKKDIGSLNTLPIVCGDLACILYTSGTTGLPKGVKITRKSLLNVSQYYTDTYDLSSDDIFGLFSSIGFDVSSFVISAVMYSGASLCVIPEEFRFNMIKMNDYFMDHGVTHTFITTQVAKLFMQSIGRTSLNVLLVAGEKLGKVDSPVNYQLVDAFGPTEAFSFVSSIDNSLKINESSVGILNYNTKAYVLDDELRLVPNGAVGELYLAGYQVAQGYLNREEETNNAFIENLFDDNDEYSILYRTGDMVRILSDGSLGIVGRRDSQVKVRGNRVELGEIESVIREIDYVEDVTVQTIFNEGNNELVSYVVVSNDLDDDDLREDICNFVLERKPEYMVPSFVVKLDSIPLNVNGKVDKRALPDVDIDSLSTGYVLWTNETEKVIMQSFEEVFNRENISLFDDFIRLGGDSITAIRLISLLEKAGISCTSRDILTYKSPYLIAQHVDKLVDEESYESVEGIVDLSPIQEYFFDQINTNFTQQFVLKSNMPLDSTILQTALDELANIHDMLRAVYRFDENNRPIQEILPKGTSVCQLKEYEFSDNFDENMRNILIDSMRSIDIESRLLEVSLIHYNDDSYLIFVIHHLIIDGISWNLLLVDLTYIYFRLMANKEIDLVRPYPYKLWVEDVRDLVNDISEAEKQHWIELNNLLDDSEIKGNPNIFAFNQGVNYSSENLLTLSEEEYWALAIARAYKKTYGKDIIFNYESHGRDESLANLSRTIGWFTSQYPISVKITNKDDNISLMKDVYAIKNAFKEVKHLGLNYSSLIYISHELEYKHCPVTFNFLSKEFVFENKLFKSINTYLFNSGEINTDLSGLINNDFNDSIGTDSNGSINGDSNGSINGGSNGSINDSSLENNPNNGLNTETYGITFNVAQVDDSYLVSGNYASNTYISDRFDEFVQNIKSELEFLENYQLDECLVCSLSESQLGIYLDEKVNDKGTAYSISALLECGANKSVEELKDIIHYLINKHPILKGRIVVDYDMFFLVCDNDPSIEVLNEFEYSKLIRPFDLNESLARFYIVDNNDTKAIFYEIHHIIGDGMSRILINDEINQALDGKFDDDVDLGFIYDSRDSFESKFNQDYDDAHEFFTKHLSDIDETYGLLADLNGSKGRISLPIKDVRENIEIFTQKLGISISTFFNAVFAYAYSRFTGSEKVYYNFTEHGRHENYSQNAVSMFFRTIPLIIDCSDSSVENYLIEVSDLVLESMKNSIYPYASLVNEFDLNNDVIFQYNLDLNDVSGIGDEIVYADTLLDPISDLFCVVNDLDDGFVVSVEYSDKFSKDTIVRFVNVFKEIFAQILEKDYLSDIEYTDKNDMMLLDSYNETEQEVPYDDVLDAFNDNLKKYSNSNLVTCGAKTYTFGEGAYIADKIAKCLCDLGIKSQDCVAFLVERSEYYMFSILGIMSIGSVYVPLDSNLLDERIGFMIQDTESKVLIVSDNTFDRAKNLIEDNIILLNISEILDDGLGTLSDLPVVYGDLACILYTSGSTGVPKGVKIARGSLPNFVDFHVSDLGIVHGDVYGLYASIGFDVAMAAIFSVVYSGACLDVVPDEIKLDISLLNSHFVEFGVTHSYITTQVAKLFVENVADTSLRVLVAGGEKLGDLSTVRDYRVVDAYGPTEACVYVASAEISDKIDSSSVGPVHNNVKAYILDKEFRRVPVGAVGDLYLSSCQLAEGYLNREEETRGAFVSNPFEGSDSEYAVMYNTGDVARLLPDGSYGIVGRRDGQVKVRGNRVELSEVEYAIRDLAEVEDVSVQTFINNGNNELVAYVVVSDSLNDDRLDFICEHVANQKPVYMVPSYVMALDEIPLNVNGKVDKRALPGVDLDSLRVEYVAPTLDLEKKILNVFELVFDVSGIGVDDDFIRLGGDSISAIRVVSLLEKEGVSCSARDILNFKTPYLIARNIGDVVETSYESTVGEVDLLPIQSNFFYDIGLDSFSQSFVLRSKVDLDLDVLQVAFDELTDVHDMLRAVYRVCDDGSVVQEVLPLGTRVCDIVECSFDELSDIKGVVDGFRDSLDIGGSLVKVALVVCGGESYIVFVIHHLIVDGVSWSILVDDLTYILDNMCSGADFSLSVPYPYKDWVADVKNLVLDISDSEMQDWAEVNSLLDDSVICGKSSVFSFSVGADFDVDNRLMLTEEEFWALAIARAYKRTFGRDVIFNRESYGRDESIANLSRTVGWFTSPYPVLVDVGVDCDHVSLMRDVYSLKDSFYKVNHLGLNYGSLVFVTGDLEFKHCPVTFNFLSNEFGISNELFESVSLSYLDVAEELSVSRYDYDYYGVSFNVSRVDNSYVVNGVFADGSFIGDGFEEFVDNIRFELGFIGSLQADDCIVCCLSEPQFGIYLDEMVNDKGTAYYTSSIVDCGLDLSVDEIRGAIDFMISRHPVLKGRILVDADVPLLVCDSYPSVEFVEVEDVSSLIRPFDLGESLARFYVVDDGMSRFVFYDVHHIITDAISLASFNVKLKRVLNGDLDIGLDLGFLYESRDSFESRFKPEYESAHEFFASRLADVGELNHLSEDVDGSRGQVIIPIRGVRSRIDTFSHKHNITVSNLLNAVFAYAYSLLIDSDKVYYNFTEHGRHKEVNQDAFGMFIRIIPLIVDCTDCSINNYLVAVSDLILESMENSIYPYASLVNEFDLNPNVLFQYNLGFNEVSHIKEEIIMEDSLVDPFAEFFCVVNDLNDGFSLTINHSDKYSQDTALQFVKAFKEVLIQFLDKGELGDINISSNEDI